MKKLIILLCLLPFSALAASPSFSSFDTTQFGTNGQKVSVKNASTQSNNVFLGNISIDAVPGGNSGQLNFVGGGSLLPDGANGFTVLGNVNLSTGVLKSNGSGVTNLPAAGNPKLLASTNGTAQNLSIITGVNTFTSPETNGSANSVVARDSGANIFANFVNAAAGFTTPGGATIGGDATIGGTVNVSGICLLANLTAFFNLDGSGSLANGVIIWDADGNLSVQTLNQAQFTPANSTDNCAVGRIAVDDNFIYVGDGTSHWKKAALLPF